VTAWGQEGKGERKRKHKSKSKSPLLERKESVRRESVYERKGKRKGK